MIGEAAFKHTAFAPAILAVGNGLTVMITLPDCNCEHAVEDASCTLINV